MGGPHLVWGGFPVIASVLYSIDPLCSNSNPVMFLCADWEKKEDRDKGGRKANQLCLREREEERRQMKKGQRGGKIFFFLNRRVDKKKTVCCIFILINNQTHHWAHGSSSALLIKHVEQKIKRILLMWEKRWTRGVKHVFTVLARHLVFTQSTCLLFLMSTTTLCIVERLFHWKWNKFVSKHYYKTPNLHSTWNSKLSSVQHFKD